MNAGYRVDNHGGRRERASSDDRRQSEGDAAVCQQLHAGRRQAEIPLNAYHSEGKSLTDYLNTRYLYVT